MKSDYHLIASIRRNAHERIQFGLAEYYGRTWIDIRVFWRGDNGIFRPGRKGIVIDPARFDEFLDCAGQIYEMWKIEKKRRDHRS